MISYGIVRMHHADIIWVMTAIIRPIAGELNACLFAHFVALLAVRG